jgi:hypothetical protein
MPGVVTYTQTDTVELQITHTELDARDHMYVAAAHLCILTTYFDNPSPSLVFMFTAGSRASGGSE